MSIRTRLLLLAVLALPCGCALAASPARQDYAEAIGRAADAQRGAQLYKTCAGCHRDNGRGNQDGSVPLIAGQHRLAIIKQLTDYRHAQRWDPRMQHYADNHVLQDVQAIADVAAHVAGLPREGAVGAGRGDQLAFGRAIYVSSCASCHGARGEGSEVDGVPRIAGQHYGYLLRQLYDTLEGRRPTLAGDHMKLLDPLVRDELVGLADVLARRDLAPR